MNRMTNKFHCNLRHNKKEPAMENELLSPVEKRNLKALEKIIDDGLKGFVAVGTALRQISEEKLYRTKYESFEEYLKERWTLGRSYAYKIMQGSEIAERIPAITNEGQAREMAKVPYTDQKEVYDRAKERAELEGRPVIARDIHEAATEPSSMTARDVVDEVWKEENCSELWDMGVEVVEELKELTRKLAAHPEGCWLQAHADTLDLKIRDIKTLIIHARPEGPCPMCAGGLKQSCEVCRSRGWLPSSRLKSVQKKLQAEEEG